MRGSTPVHVRAARTEPRWGHAQRSHEWRCMQGGAWNQGRIVNRLDRERLYDAMPFSIPMTDQASEVFRLLAVATPLAPEMIPPSLVTMNSVVCVRDLDTGQADTYDLVYPFDAARRPLGRSITAPCGAAMFGRYIGERIAWHGHEGERRAVIDSIEYQPEREGHHDR